MAVEPKKSRAVLLDSYPLFREGLRKVLTNSREFVCVGATNDAEQALKLVLELLPDLLILDINAIIDAGVFFKKIKSFAPGCRIVVLTHSQNDSDIDGSVKSGVDGYLLKSLDEIELLNAVRTVLSGKQVLCDEVRLRLSQGLKGGSRDNSKYPLRQREIELVQLAAEGLTNKEIAGRLNISEHTVASHLMSVYRKLNIGCRVEAVRLSVENGWICRGKVSESKSSDCQT